MTRHATMTNRNDIQNSMHVLAMTWSSTTPPLGVSDTHTCSPSSEDPHNASIGVKCVPECSSFQPSSEKTACSWVVTRSVSEEKLVPPRRVQSLSTTWKFY